MWTTENSKFGKTHFILERVTAIKSFVSFVKQTRTTIEATSDETALKKSNIMMIIILTFAHRLTLWIC